MAKSEIKKESPFSLRKGSLEIVGVLLKNTMPE
jgi:hypothetical protein